MPSASTACCTVDGEIGARLRQRIAQDATSEHLRRLRVPQPFARLRAGDASGIIGALQRGHHRYRPAMPPTSSSASSRCRRASDARSTHGRAASWTTTQSSFAASANASSASRTVAARVAPPQRSGVTRVLRADRAIVPAVFRSQRHVDPVQRQARRETIDRMLQHRLAVEQRAYCFGVSDANRGTRSGSGDQRVITVGPHRRTLS